MFEYNKLSIGSRIRQIRKEKQMTLKEFSQLLDVPISSISSWERGANVPSSQNLKLLSEKTGVDSNWILYGDIADYLQDIFDYYHLNEVISEEKFFELEKVLKEMHYKPGDFNRLKDTAALIIPNFEELINHEDEEKTLSAHMLKNEFPILNDYHFQTNYLPLLQGLLSDENKEHNSDIILFLLDLLSRMNNTTKPIIKKIFRDLNWLLSNNIFRLEREHQSNYPSFGGIHSADAYEKQEDRDYRDIKEDAEQLIQEISTRLKDVVELNYEAFKKREHKSIF
ncbi:hypothetical protein J8TS2_22530 [Lederbergia ruris]|uniref:HTH cro/C1-type domain-containing protein n=1 Tax=Lederbergia ruris TaxID=217495 RepID=A0ABQ4KIZ5_9BACI|nr:helix-turn-helix domain-containing protein [Lederbergia ruris]GIN57934.1 hypothetical protein J8TS2_22530 [Lederbergia ruris]